MHKVTTHGLKVVFTGPAFGPDGQAILRADLANACLTLGMVVYENYTRGVEILVASRKDTVKARKAAQDGLAVLTYPEFITTYGIEVQTALHTVTPRHKFVDTHYQPGVPHPSLLGGDLL